MTRRSRSLLAAVFAALLLLAACGGGDSDDSGGSPLAEQSSDDGGESSDDAPSEDDSSDDDSSDDGDGDGGDSGGGSPLGGGGWCDRARAVQDIFDEQEVDPFSLFSEEGFDRLLDAFDLAFEGAPSEISDDIDTVRSAFTEVRDLLVEVDFDIFALSEADLSALEDPALEEATNNIEDYLREDCGFEIDEDEPVVTEPMEDDGDMGDEVPSDVPFDQLMVDSLMQSLGLSEEQAACLVDNLDLGDLAASGGELSDDAFNDLFGLFSTCDIDLTQLTG